MKNPILSIFFSLILFSLSAQVIHVAPYLQDAKPNSIRVLWETTEGEESIVEWGGTPTLGNSSIGTAAPNQGASRIHDVLLEGLTRFTTYYYRVQTGTAISEVYQFKTPPFASDLEPFRILAMSDIQKSGANPNKFLEVVEDGIVDYMAGEFGGELSDNIAMVLIPGDLVVTGSNYSQWENDFFTPGQSLFTQVPIYPVPGNHEQNTIFFFNYFNLPNNGIPGQEEHSWYKDYGNVRIIGLDSNNPYANAEQITWLENVLTETCTTDSIDFVFAQLHHPHKSELWTPGESNFTGDVINQLEMFTGNCGKPSIHFFGHTHGYSRGQSRDHKHLWINVATAGGAIDHWGEFPNFDYDEFSKSQDEWGFVTVDVTPGDDAQFTVKRISRGNEANFRNNEVRDSITIKLQNSSVQTPAPIFPLNEIVNPSCVVLKADDFVADNPGFLHGQSHWQLSTNCDDFSTPVLESWKNYENWYFYQDTQNGDDMTDEQVISLNENSNYCWRVRYRDREMNWSEWSTPAPFSTEESDLSSNLLLNSGAESGIFGWTVISGALESLTDGECNGISPHSGTNYFAVGGVCEDNPYGKAIQDINVVSYADSIDAGALQINWGGHLSDFSGADLPAMKVIFLDQNSIALDSTDEVSTLNSNWTLFSGWHQIPEQTRNIQFVITGTRNAGNDNDSYCDDLFLRIGKEGEGCDEYIPVATSDPIFTVANLEVVPNPFSNTAIIKLPRKDNGTLSIDVRNVLGQKVECLASFHSNQITLHRNGLVAGVYFFALRDGNEIVGEGKFMVD